MLGLPESGHPVTPSPEDLMPSFDLQGHLSRTWKNSHKNKLVK